MKLAEYSLLIRRALETPPGEDAHLELSPLGRLKSSLALQEATNVKPSAVAVILSLQEELEIILTLRQDYQGKHSGQISFPGGKKEPSDNSLIQTAIRETEEEIGIKITEEMYLGKLTDVYIPVSNFHIEPHVFLSDQRFQIRRDEREVKEVFHLLESELLAEESRAEATVYLGNDITKKVPCFQIKERIIWGATALILNELKSILLGLNMSKQKENSN